MQKKYLVDIFCHIRQVAARIAKLVLEGAFGTITLGREDRSGSATIPFKRAMVFPMLSIVTTLYLITNL